MNLSEISQIIGIIYEAVDDDHAWPRILDKIRLMLRADSALLFTPMNSQYDDGIEVIINSDEWSVKAYHGHFNKHDIWYSGSKIRKLDRPGNVVLGEELVDDEIFQKSEWFNDFLIPSGQCRLLGANLDFDHHASIPAFLNFYNKSKFDRFSEDDKKIVKFLIQHMQKAFLMRARRRETLKAKALLEGAFNADGKSYLILNTNLHIVMKNSIAIDVLCKKDGLYASSDGRLRCTRRQDGERLSKMITRVSAVSPLGHTAIRDLIFHRPSDGRAVLLQASAMENLPCQEKHILVSLTLLGADHSRVSIAALRELGLSASEARLAAIIGSGIAPIDAAAELNISEGNVRTSLKKIFAKLEINRQSELAVIVTKLANGRVPVR